MDITAAALTEDGITSAYRGQLNEMVANILRVDVGIRALIQNLAGQLERFFLNLFHARESKEFILWCHANRNPGSHNYGVVESRLPVFLGIQKSFGLLTEAATSTWGLPSALALGRALWQLQAEVTNGQVMVRAGHGGIATPADSLLRCICLNHPWLHPFHLVAVMRYRGEKDAVRKHNAAVLRTLLTKVVLKAEDVVLLAYGQNGDTLVKSWYEEELADAAEVRAMKKEVKRLRDVEKESGKVRFHQDHLLYLYSILNVLNVCHPAKKRKAAEEPPLSNRVGDDIGGRKKCQTVAKAKIQIVAVDVIEDMAAVTGAAAGTPIY